MDEGTRKGFELAGLIVGSIGSFVFGALRLAEGILDGATLWIVIGVFLLATGVVCAVQAHRLHNGA